MKPHTIKTTHIFGGETEFPFSGSLSEAKEAARRFVASGWVVSILTNRGTTWRIKDGRWVHDTGRKG